MMPAAETPLLHVAEDPDRAWAEYGEHFLHEARTYASWQSDGHPLGGAVGGHDGRRSCARRACTGSSRRRSAWRWAWTTGPASAVRRDAGRGGLAQSAAVLRTCCPGSRTLEAEPPGSRPSSTRRGAAGTGPLPNIGEGGGQPISSSALPLVSFTNLSTKGMESTAKTV